MVGKSSVCVLQPSLLYPSYSSLLRSMESSKRMAIIDNKVESFHARYNGSCVRKISHFLVRNHWMLYCHVTTYGCLDSNNTSKKNTTVLIKLPWTSISFISAFLLYVLIYIYDILSDSHTNQTLFSGRTIDGSLGRFLVNPSCATWTFITTCWSCVFLFLKSVIFLCVCLAIHRYSKHDMYPEY